MSDSGNQAQQPNPAPTCHRRRGRRLLIGGAAAVALLAGAIGVAKAVEEQHTGMWHMHGGSPVGMIEHRADRALGRVDATPEQQAKVHAIIEAAAHDLEPLGATMHGTHAEIANLLAAPQIDRAAVERLRAARVATIEQISQRVTLAVEDAAEVLTPEQRVKLKQIMPELDRHEHVPATGQN